MMRSFISLKNRNFRPFPSNLSEYDDVRLPEALIEHFLNIYTKSGDSVLDIFAGFGTSLFVAQEMKRIPYGIECEKALCDYIRENLSTQFKDNIIHGDCRHISSLNLPKVNFLITSPPYMQQEDKEAPLTAYRQPGNYQNYLNGLQGIFSDLREIIQPGGYLVVEASNLFNREKNTITTLAWDIGKKLAEIMQFKGEIIVSWTQNGTKTQKDGTYGYGYDHSYCLVYQNF